MGPPVRDLIRCCLLVDAFESSIQKLLPLRLLRGFWSSCGGLGFCFCFCFGGDGGGSLVQLNNLALVDDGAVGVERADCVLLVAKVDADGDSDGDSDGDASSVRADGRCESRYWELVGVAAGFLDVVFVIIGSERITMLAHPSQPSHLISLSLLVL